MRIRVTGLRPARAARADDHIDSLARGNAQTAERPIIVRRRKGDLPADKCSQLTRSPEIAAPSGNRHRGATLARPR